MIYIYLNECLRICFLKKTKILFFLIIGLKLGEKARQLFSGAGAQAAAAAVNPQDSRGQAAHIGLFF